MSGVRSGISVETTSAPVRTDVPAIAVAEPEVILGAWRARRLGLGGGFPAGPLGAVRDQAGRTIVFTPNGSAPHFGTLRLSVDRLVQRSGDALPFRCEPPLATEGSPMLANPVLTGSKPCGPQPAPKRPSAALPFDWNDAAGAAPWYDARSNTLLLLYRGAFYRDASLGGGTGGYATGHGLAASIDGGYTFVRCGEIVRPYLPRTMVRRHDIGIGTLLEHDGYLYDFYVDLGPGGKAMLTAARACTRDVLDAVVRGGDVWTLWKKHSTLGGGSAAASEARFNQPAIVDPADHDAAGGRFSPLFDDARSEWDAATQPAAFYCKAARRFVIVYVVGPSLGIALRTSRDAVTWSAPAWVVKDSYAIAHALSNSAGADAVFSTLAAVRADRTIPNCRSIAHPAILTTGAETAVRGRRFWVTFVDSSVSEPLERRWSRVRLELR